MHPVGSLVPAAGVGLTAAGQPRAAPFFQPPVPSLCQVIDLVGFPLPAGPLSWPEHLALSTQARLSRASAGRWQMNAQLKLYPP